jgi:hypothetical protein
VAARCLRVFARAHAPRAAQGPMCVGQTGGSWAGFLSDTRRAGETHGILRWQARTRSAHAAALACG